VIELYTANTPNGKKISIMLEEIGYEYNVNTIDLNKKISRFNLEGGLVIITSNIDIDFPFSERVIL